MKLILCHANDNWANAIKAQLPQDLEVESYNEFYKKERSKSFRVKGGFGARATPFALFYYGEDNKEIKPFYSESNNCSEQEIVRYINLIYSQNVQSQSNQEDKE